MSEEATPKHKKGSVVVIAVDGSEYSEYALQFYKEHLHMPDNLVYLVHSTEYKCITRPDMTMVTQEIESEERKADHIVEQLTKEMDKMKLTAKIERVHGEAGPAILHVVNEKHADYIVVGCRGKGTVRRTFTGSVTDYITHHAKVPVMIARHKDHMHHYHLNPFHHSHKQHDDDKKH